VKITCDVIRAVLFEGETGCVKITCDVIRAVVFEGEIGFLKLTYDVIYSFLGNSTPSEI